MSQNATTGREESALSQTTVGIILPPTDQHVATYTYDFAKQGGAIGTIVLPGETIPSGAFIVDSYIDYITALAGASATAALTLQSAGDIVVAAAVNAAPWSDTPPTRSDAKPTYETESGYLKLTAPRVLSLVIATAVLTGGKFNVYVYWNVGV